MKRLRYGVADEQWALIVELAKIFSLDPKIVLAFSTSIGLRFLDMSLVHPLAGLGKAVDERGEQVAATVLADLTKSVNQGTPAMPTSLTAEVASDSKQAVPRKRTPYKRK